MTINETLKNYEIRSFPKMESAIYVLIGKHKNIHFPFYVGETNSLYVRIRDYRTKSQFACPTDFKVGIAIQYFERKGIEIEIATQEQVTISKRRMEEKDKCAIFRNQGYLLLNDLQGYDYKTADADDEIHKIKLYCDKILERQGLYDL